MKMPVAPDTSTLGGAEIRDGFHFILHVIEPHHALMVI